MYIPSAKTAKPKAPLFPQARKIQMEQRLGGDIQELCKKLAQAVRTPDWRETFWKFRDVMYPNGILDDTRLPVTCISPNANRKQAVLCVYARLAWIIRLYWKLCVTESGNEAHIRQYMAELDSLLAKGESLEATLKRCDVMGDERTGYWLHIPE